MGDHAVFPPQIMVEIKALACELPSRLRLPLSRLSSTDIAYEAVRSGIVASISGATVWRWLNADAIKPWQYRSWIFPRDPDFIRKASQVLDLYQGVWKGKQLTSNDYVISADEKTSIQARCRKAPATPPGQNAVRKVEAEYERRGALAYIAAWDVRRAKVFGVCTKKTGIVPFRQLVDQVMKREPYCSANRVFWVTDNGSSHRGKNSIERMSQWYKNAYLVHTPIHASWLNQIEIYFSVVQRKCLMPNEFDDLHAVEQQLIAFQSYYEEIATPFHWKFTKENLKMIMNKISKHDIKIAA